MLTLHPLPQPHLSKVEWLAAWLTSHWHLILIGLQHQPAFGQEEAYSSYSATKKKQQQVIFPKHKLNISIWVKKNQTKHYHVPWQSDKRNLIISSFILYGWNAEFARICVWAIFLKYRALHFKLILVFVTSVKMLIYMCIRPHICVCTQNAGNTANCTWHSCGSTLQLVVLSQ